MQNLLKFYDDLQVATGCYMSIGGSIALYMQNDPSINRSSYVPGDIDISVATEEDVAICSAYLEYQGYKKTIDNIDPFMFTVRKQYKKGDEKHDFFVNPGIKTWSTLIDGRYYTRPELIWAARAFYAGNNYLKAFNQLAEAGMVVSVTNAELRLRSRAKKFLGNLLRLKRLLFGVLLYVVAKRSPETWKVGAIYRKGYRISWGYNASATYGKHAEDMALERFSKWYKQPAEGGVLWCTFSPCTHCAKTLKSRGIISSYVHKYAGKL